MMGEWKEYKLGDVCSRLSSGKNIRAEFVKDSGLYPVYGGNGLRGYTDNFNFEGECGIIGRQGAYCGNVRFFKGKGYMTEHAVVVQGNEFADTYYLSSLLSTMHLERLSGQSAQPGLAVGTLSVQNIVLPDISIQKKISSILSSLDAKIENNNKINANLEAQAQALFKSWFVDFEPFQDGEFQDSELGRIPKGWKVSNLTSIATYMNGLAMQKFPPKPGEDSYPVLKIKELGQGKCDDSSDRCTKDIKPDYIIDNGDVIFSWSGTLLVDIWCGGKCGLNQHLFKVTSNNYPKWFYLYWTKHHLKRFIHIAQDKAVTMGHIKRGHLDEAKVLIPDDKTLKEIDNIFKPIVEEIINLNIENTRLSTLRDTLLPKLMSGEIEV